MTLSVRLCNDTDTSCRLIAIILATQIFRLFRKQIVLEVSQLWNNETDHFNPFLSLSLNCLLPSSKVASFPCLYPSTPSPYQVSYEGTSSFGFQVFTLANHIVLESIAFVWQVIHLYARGGLCGGGGIAAFRNRHMKRGFILNSSF